MEFNYIFQCFFMTCFIKLAITVSKRENLNLVNRFSRIYHNMSSSLPLCTSGKKYKKKGKGLLMCERLIPGTPANAFSIEYNAEVQCLANDECYSLWVCCELPNDRFQYSTTKHKRI